jgi:DNA-binding transcriptional ArsR family regulator
MPRKRKKPTLSGTVGAGSPLDQRVARGLAHPLRAEILAYLTEHPVSCPSEMWKAGVGKGEAGTQLSNISYHTRVLEELALIELVKEEPVRGATAHFYRAISRMFLDVETWKKLPKDMRTGISVKALEETFDRASDAVKMGTFDSRDERSIINLGLRLDDEGFKSASKKLDELMYWLQAEEAAALRRSQEMGVALSYNSVSLLLYESPPNLRPETERLPSEEE